jgi:hypothetical protein
VACVKRLPIIVAGDSNPQTSRPNQSVELGDIDDLTVEVCKPADPVPGPVMSCSVLVDKGPLSHLTRAETWSNF